MKSKILFFLLLLLGFFKSQETTVELVESSGGCGLSTDCANDIITFDIIATIDSDKDLDSWNIWLQYDQSVLSRLAIGPNDNSGQGDNTCLEDNGLEDVDVEASLG